MTLIGYDGWRNRILYHFLNVNADKVNRSAFHLDTTFLFYNKYTLEHLPEKRIRENPASKMHEK